MKKSNQQSIKRIISLALIFLGGYYLLIAIGIIPSQIIIWKFSPTNKQLAIVSLVIIVTGLLVDDIWRRKIKGAFQ
jgi:hypothetical protein